MENKEKLNQNPAEEVVQPKEEKSAAKETAKVSNETEDVKVEETTDGDGKEEANEAPQTKEVETPKEEDVVAETKEETDTKEVEVDETKVTIEAVKSEEPKAEVAPKAEETPKKEDVVAEIKEETETKEVEVDETKVTAEAVKSEEPKVEVAPEAEETPKKEDVVAEIKEETETKEVEVDETKVTAEAVKSEEPKVEVAPEAEETPKKEDVVAETKEKTDTKEVEVDETKVTAEAVKSEESKADEAPKAEETTEESSDEGDDGDHDDQDDEEEEEVSEETYHSHTMEELVLELEKINEENAIKNTKNKVGFIRLAFGRKLEELKAEAKEKFVENGGDLEEYKPEPIELERQFRNAFSKYKSLRRQFRQQQEVQMQENLQKKNELLEEMRELVSSDESLKETYDKFNEIQGRWKEIGMIPKAEIQLLWNNYHFLVEKFFDKVKINKELRDLDLKKNLDAKIELCEKAEELLIEESINKSFKLLQEYHNEWKAIGPVPSANNDEVWERFKSTSDKINERRRAHYEELQGKLEENYTAKQALCAKAEEIVLKPVNSAKEWAERTNEFEELFKVWRTFGPAPRKQNEEVWATFKGYMNQFYEAKKNFFKELKSEQQDNYHRKLDLVKQSEALKDSTDWNNTTKTLIGLQKEWKKIGPVPRKYSDEIWKQFRSANDFFFEAKSKHFKGQFEVEETNLKEKKALVEEIKKAEFGEDKKENLEKIKAFQRKWSEIGNVPRKEMDKLYKSYRAVVDEQLDKLNISSVDFRNAGFKDRIDDLKKKDDDYALRKERQFIQKNIDKLKEDVLLWENNMGFFRHSKNADVLKMEFEKKIQKAKAEILVFKEKKRLIDK